MALISIAMFDSKENNRFDMTMRTLASLAKTVDFNHHRLFVVDNGSDPELLQKVKDTQHEQTYYGAYYAQMYGEMPPFMLIENGENLGTAKAVNKGWAHRKEDEVCVKMDNDVVIHQAGWLDLIEEVFRRDPTTGICALKRKDLEERPNHPNTWFNSTLRMLPHEKGTEWIVVEEVAHCMGTCQGYNPRLLEKIGFLEQGDSVYGFDDSLAAARCNVAGFSNDFLPHIVIDHIDPGGTEYTEWKVKIAGDHWQAYHIAVAEYRAGKRPLYCGPEGRPW